MNGPNLASYASGMAETVSELNKVQNAGWLVVELASQRKTDGPNPSPCAPGTAETGGELQKFQNGRESRKTIFLQCLAVFGHWDWGYPKVFGGKEHAGIDGFQF